MKKLFAIIMTSIFPYIAIAQGVIFEKEDSIRIESMLHDLADNKPTAELLTGIANAFVGEKYVPGTLEQGIDEPLTISCSRLDCTTFVELVVAIAVSARNGDTDFSSVCRNLERIRYRNGKNCGYASRLHYISWWITDGAKSGIVQEITALMSNERQGGTLDYMSTHPDSYPLLVEHPRLINEIANHEKISNMDNTCYIPKERLSNCSTFDIREGDIIAITTSIKGLDVTHIGFAYYNNGELCLLHASSEKGMVIKESRPLYDYLKNRKRHTGIRVFRAVF